MAKKKSSSAPKNCAGNSVPIDITGPSSDRIGVANHGAYQCQILMKRALYEIEGWADECSPHFILRALLTRAHSLAVATGDLLAAEEGDEKAVQAARDRVMHG